MLKPMFGEVLLQFFRHLLFDPLKGYKKQYDLSDLNARSRSMNEKIAVIYSRYA